MIKYLSSLQIFYNEDIMGKTTMVRKYEDIAFVFFFFLWGLS